MNSESLRKLSEAVVSVGQRGFVKDGKTTAVLFNRSNWLKIPRDFKTRTTGSDLKCNELRPRDRSGGMRSVKRWRAAGLKIDVQTAAQTPNRPELLAAEATETDMDGDGRSCLFEAKQMMQRR